MPKTHLLLAAAASLVALTASAAGPPPSLALPIACELGRTCFIQSYPDRDPGPGRRDHRCTAQTYDGHDGLDIRLPTLAAQRAGVAVLAAAPGVVRGARDGVADVSTRTAGRAAVQGRECGNGVAIVHANGWETQYCHLARGSIRIREGQTVAAGTPLGNVGLSGDTEFPHVHLTVREDGRAVDPFAYGAPAAACSGGRNLFDARAAAALAYRPGEVINLGFAGGAVAEAQIDAAATTPVARSAPLVLYARAVNLRGGDVQTLAIAGPNGRPVVSRALAPLDRDKASYYAFAGERPSGGAWAAGVYRGRYTVTRGGRIVIDRSVTITL